MESKILSKKDRKEEMYKNRWNKEKTNTDTLNMVMV